MQRAIFLSCILVCASVGTALAQSAPKPHDPKEHATWFAKYAFKSAERECNLLNAEPDEDRVGTIAECLSKDGKEVSKYRINMGDNMFAVTKIVLISTTPR